MTDHTHTHQASSPQPTQLQTHSPSIARDSNHPFCTKSINPSFAHAAQPQPTSPLTVRSSTAITVSDRVTTSRTCLKSTPPNPRCHHHKSNAPAQERNLDHQSTVPAPVTRPHSGVHLQVQHQRKLSAKESDERTRHRAFQCRHSNGGVRQAFWILSVRSTEASFGDIEHVGC